MPGLIALGAHVIVRGGEIEREMPLEDLYLAYQKKDMAEHEFVVGLKVPTRTGVRKNLQFRTTNCRSVSTRTSRLCAPRSPSSPTAT
jgi:Xanthine dehydrogenase, iron-sulfur cluster and FAD-binding subunit A